MQCEEGTDWLLELLMEVQLQQYFLRIRDDLNVTRLSHFDYVKNEDLEKIGMGRPGELVNGFLFLLLLGYMGSFSAVGSVSKTHCVIWLQPRISGANLPSQPPRHDFKGISGGWSSLLCVLVVCV